MDIIHNMDQEMDTSSTHDQPPKKRNVVAAGVVVFLLLLIPVGLYFVTQQQSVADTRSQAAILYKAAPIAQATPTPTPLVTNASRCNKSCTKDTDCSTSGDMVCANINGAGQCRAANCPEVTDCWCNKTVACNTPCTENSQCGTGKICAKIDGVQKCRSSECYAVDDCLCYVIGGSPTPTPTPLFRCNSSCSGDADCGTSMICVKTAEGNKCRNPQCYGTADCLCYSLLDTPTPTPKPTVKATTYTRPVTTATPKPTVTPTGAPILLADILVPSVTPTIAPVAPELTITAFYDAKRETGEKPVISGVSVPNAEIALMISPDGLDGALFSDATGSWNYTPTQALTAGSKQLTVTATAANGAKTVKTDVFTVRSSGIPMAVYVILGLVVAAGAGVGIGIVFSRKQKPPEPVPPTV